MPKNGKLICATTASKIIARGVYRSHGIRIIHGVVIGALTALFFIAKPPHSFAQPTFESANWPNRPIRLIVPFPPGGAVDVVARIIATRLSARLGKQLVVENRPGASGTIGSAAVARSAADGYTLGIGTTSTHALAVTLNPELSYNPVKDFAPIGMIGSAPYVLTVYPSVQANSVLKLVQLAKSQPGKLSYASAGATSLAHLSGLLFEKLAGVKLRHIPYHSSEQSVVDLISGRIDMQFATIAPVLPFIRSGKLSALGTTGANRAGVLPSLPTLAESGLAGFDSALWMALFMPAKTPTAIVARLNKEVNAVLAMPDVKEALATQGLDLDSGMPEDVAGRIETDIKKWRDVIKSNGIASD